MSSDEAENKNIEESPKEASSSTEEKEEKNDEKVKEDQVNNKAAAKKKGADPPKIKQPAKKRVKSEQAEKETNEEEEKEDKKKSKAIKEDEDEEDEESDEENDVNHKVVPLLDQPLEVSGKRKSREVQRFKPEKETKETKIPEGKGKALGDIERIDFNIQRAKPEDLKILHRLCFSKPGKAATVKNMVKKFKGFDFSVDSDEYKKKKEVVEKSFKKVTVAQLKNICNIIDVERSGTKDELVERILKFITCPVDSGKKLPGGGRSKRKGASNKNYEEGEESHKSRKKSKAKKKEAESSESEDEKEEDEDEEEDEKEAVEEKEEEKKKKKKKKEDEKEKADESEEEKSEEEEEKPKKTAKKSKKAAEAADKKAPPKKRAAAKNAVEKKSDSEADDESEDEEPLAKKVKTPPTDEDIKTYVKSLLDGANLELITMKKVCQDVYAHYPEFDLSHKKDFIKTTVKNLISS